MSTTETKTSTSFENMADMGLFKPITPLIRYMTYETSDKCRTLVLIREIVTGDVSHEALLQALSKVDDDTSRALAMTCYNLLHGSAPFFDGLPCLPRDSYEKFGKASSKVFPEEFSSEEIQTITNEAKELVAKLVAEDWGRRALRATLDLTDLNELRTEKERESKKQKVVPT